VLYNGQKERNAVHSGVVRIPWQKLDKQHLALDAGQAPRLSATQFSGARHDRP
jgi:hypothetical protein